MWRIALAALFVVGLVSASPYIIIEKRTTISGNGTGNGTSDGNNYTTAISVSGSTTKTLNLARFGMVNLTASWEDLTGASVESDPVFYGNTSLICWANGTNCLPDDAYNASYLTAEADPIFKGNTSLICWSNGTNCQPDDAYNASYLTAEADPIFKGNTSLICWSNGTNCVSYPANEGGMSNVTQFNSTNRSIIWTNVNSTTRDAVVNLTWATANCAAITGSAALCDGDDAAGGGGAVPVMNITFKPAFREILFGSPAGGTVASLHTTARCSSFPVEQGTQVFFDNVKLLVDTTNSTIGAYFAIYNCTSGNTFDCSTGTLHKVNTTRFSFGASAMQGVTNTTGNWTLVQGNYVMCTMTNTTNTQAGVFRGVTGSSGTGSTLRLTVAGGFPASASFTASEADVVPYVYLYREAGVK